MRHLSSKELVDLVDGTLAATRAAHVETCESCRRQADDMRAVIAQARAAEVPEPSPLFWDHLSARIREGVGAAGEPSREPWWRLGLVRFGVPVTALVAVVVAAVVVRGPGLSRRLPPIVPLSAPEGGAAIETFPPAAEGDAEWSLVVTVAEGLDWDAARESGLGVAPGAADNVLFLLSQEERRQLGQLLKAELSRN